MLTISLLGEIHGQLLVIRRAQSVRTPDGNVRTMWRCRCACGEELDVRRSNLVTGNTESCGCLRGVGGAIRAARIAAGAAKLHRVLRPVDPAANVPPPGWTVEADRFEEDTALWEITANRKAA